MDVADRDAAESIGIVQAAVPGPSEDGVDGRARMAGQRPKSMWAPAPVDPSLEDRRDRVRSRLSWRVVRARAPILEARPALSAVSGAPLVGGRPAHALRFCGLGH